MRAELTPLVGSWLLTYLLHSTILLGIAWFVTRRRRPSAVVQDVLWKAGLIGGFATATLQTGLGFEPLGGALRVEFGGITPGARVKPAVAAPVDAWQGLLPEHNRASSVAAPRTTLLSSRPEAAPESPVATAVRATPMRPAEIALLAWAVMALAMTVLYLVQRALALRRIGPRRQVSDAALLDMLDSLRCTGRVRRQIRLTAAPGLLSPVALGGDEIALPEAALTDLDSEQQRSMLAHELAHLERRDPAWLALACLIERAWFVQPLNRLARIRVQEAAELLCDDWAVRRTGSGVSLASCLVKVAEWVDPTPRPIPLAGMAERRSQLVTRIHRLIEGRVMPQSNRSYWLLGGAVALIGATAVVAPGITPQGADLSAQGTVPATPAPEADTSTSALGRLSRELSWVRIRSRMDAARARSLARAEVRAARSLTSTAPMPAAPPAAPMAPRVPAELRAELARAPRAWAMAADLRRDGRQRDTTNIAVPALIGALKDGDVEVRRAAAQSLANLEDPRSIPALVDALRDSDAEVRAAAASALGQFEDKRAVPGLVALLKDANKDVRHAALSSLSGFRDEVPTDAIITALGDSDPDIRAAALGLASSCECSEEHPADPRIVQAVVGLIGSANTDVRSEAISAVTSLGLKEAPATLLAASKDKNPEIRQHVAEALGSIGDPRAVPALKDLIQDQNSGVRESAVNALSEIRDRTALEVLVAALKSSDAGVRRRAAEALGQRSEE